MDFHVIFSQFLYDSASLFPVIREDFYFVFSVFYYWNFFSFCQSKTKTFPQIFKVPVHLLFLVVRDPPVRLVPCSLRHQYYDSSFILPSGPSPSLYASYCAWNWLKEYHQVNFRDIQPFLPNRISDKDIEQAFPKIIKHLLLLLLRQTSLTFLLLADKYICLDIVYLVQFLNYIKGIVPVLVEYYDFDAWILLHFLIYKVLQLYQLRMLNTLLAEYSCLYQRGLEILVRHYRAYCFRFRCLRIRNKLFHVFVQRLDTLGLKKLKRMVYLHHFSKDRYGIPHHKILFSLRDSAPQLPLQLQQV